MYAPQEACGVVFDVKAIVPCRGFWALAFAFCPPPEAGAGASARSPAQKEQAKPPERESVLKRLRQLQAEGKTQKLKRKTRDMER